MYRVEIIYVLDSSYVMTWLICRDVVDFLLCDFYVETFMHDYFGDYCRRDEYFLFIYRNCMMYCLIRNRALHMACGVCAAIVAASIALEVEAAIVFAGMAWEVCAAVVFPLELI